MKTVKNILLTLVFLVVLAVVTVFIAAQFPAVQSRAAQKTAAWLSGKTGGHVEIRQMHYLLFNKIILNDISLTTAPGDTLFSARKLSVSLRAFQPLSRKIRLQRIAVEGGQFRYWFNDTTNNINTLFPPHQDPQDTVRTPFVWEISAKEVSVDDFAFLMYRDGRAPGHDNPYSIDYYDMQIRRIHLNMADASFGDGAVKARINHLDGVEKCGYTIRDFHGDVTVDAHTARVDDLLIDDVYSHVTARYFLMDFGNIDNLNDYVNKVRMELDMDNAFLSFKTIQAYAYSLDPQFLLSLYASGKAQGTVSYLYSDKLDIRSASGLTRLTAAFRMRGLTEVEQTTLQVDIPQLSSTVGDLNRILYSIAEVDLKGLEKSLGSTAPFHFNGRLAGLLTDFAVEGNLQSNFAHAQVDMVINSTYRDGVLLQGVVDAAQLDGHTLSGSDLLGNVSFYTKARAVFADKNHGGVVASIDSLGVSRLQINNYPVTDLKVKGTYTNNLFDGRIACADPNCRFLFQGKASVGGKEGIQGNFFANVAYVDLHKLNLSHGDSLTTLSGVLRADFSRMNSLGDIDGVINASDLSLHNSAGTHRIESLVLESRRTDSLHYSIYLDSDAIKATYKGQEGFLSFVSHLTDRYLYQRLPAYFHPKGSTLSGSYDLNATFYNTAFLEALLLPGLYIAPQTRLTLHGNAAERLEMKLLSDRLGYRKNNVKHLSLQAVADSQLLQIRAEASQADLFSLSPEEAFVHLDVRHNDVWAQAGYRNAGDLENSAQVNAQLFCRDSALAGSNIWQAVIPESQLVINGKEWTLRSDTLWLGGGKTAIRNFRLLHQDEYLTLNGALSENPKDTLSLDMKRFDASLLNTLVGTKYPFKFRGAFTGKGQVTDVYHTRRFTADIQGKDFYVNDTLCGDVRLMSVWDQQKGQLRLGAFTYKDNTRPLNATGFFRPSDKYLQMNASFDRFQAVLVAPFLDGLVSNVGGTVSGDMLLKGVLPELDLTSENTTVDKLGFTIDYTRVPYVVSGPVQLTKNGLYLPQDTLRDSYGHTALAQGGLIYSHFRDIGVDLNLNFTNLHALNLREQDNDDFYGTAFATGTLGIKGPLTDLAMNLAVRTEPSTFIHIPLSSASQASQADLLTFVQPAPRPVGRDPYELAARQAAQRTGERSQFTFNMKTQITPDAQMLLEINKTTGDVITARGNGMVTIGMDPKQDGFSLLGDCTLESGDYLFVLQGLLSKRFQIVPGSTLSFGGDLDNTQLDLTASYTTKASLNSLLSDSTSVSTRRNVDCQILMSGQLMNPTLGFNIEIDDIDPTTRARVESALNTDDKMMRQFMSLLISSSFMPDQESGIVNNSNLLYSNATEILSNQLNNIFAQLDIPVDVGFNYQPGQEGRDIFDVAISTQLFNNRVVVNGTMGNNPYNQSNQNSDIIGNVDIELKLDKQGKFRLKAFSHAADQYSNYLDNTQRNGGGFVYREEFNSFKELWQRWIPKKLRVNKLEGN